MDDKVIGKDEMMTLEFPDGLIQQSVEQGFFIDTGTKTEDGSPIYMFTEGAKEALLRMIDEMEEV